MKIYKFFQATFRRGFADRICTKPVRNRTLLGVAAVSAFVAVSTPAGAVPSFAEQTGQTCAVCHVGAFGPQLTPFGREFKRTAFTMRTKANIPFSAMAVASYVHTAAKQPDLKPDFAANDNVQFDEGSFFLAGGAGKHAGGFAQVTYSGVDKAWAWDNVDLRAATTTTIGGKDVVLGASMNNSPGLQDIWNTLPGFSFPYTDSDLAPGSEAATLIADALAQNTIGMTGYFWIDSKLYAEGGGYRSLSADFLDRVGVDPAETSKINGVAPYMRVAYQKDWGDKNVEVGAFALIAHLFPGRDLSAGMTDRITDFGFDASYQLFRDNEDAFTVNGRYTHESMRLDASEVLELAANNRDTLQDLRVDASYYFHNKFGLTAGVFDTWGTTDPMLYDFSRTFSPNSSGLLFQTDTTLFGREGSSVGPRFNLRVGVQYTAYFRVNGSSQNFDGLGHNAGDDNTLRLFTWGAF